ncbi:uncharacterized protein PGTG_20565, partial [Puccinia graminis f. sp. tritici CRL 75-36-700-3]
MCFLYPPPKLNLRPSLGPRAPRSEFAEDVTLPVNLYAFITRPFLRPMPEVSITPQHHITPPQPYIDPSNNPASDRPSTLQ